MRLSFRKFCVLALLFASVGLLLNAVSGSRVLTVYFIDVGQGDAAFIEFPCGRNMLVDSGGPRQANTDIAAFLRRRGARRLDAAVLSHAHADHAGGFLQVLKSVPAGLFIEPGHEHTSGIYLGLLGFLLDGGLPYKTVSAGDSLEGFGDVDILFLNPPDNFFGGESALNDNSIVMLIRYGDVRFLFTGDIESKAEEELVRVYGDFLSSDVLKVPHHGSASSSTPGFVKAVSPSLAVVSSGAENPFGHPHAAVLERYEAAGAEVRRTDTDGTVVVSTDGRKIRVSSGR